MSGKDRRSKGAPLQEDAARLMHELSARQFELESQNEALRRVTDELEAARAHYLDLYEQAPTGFLTLSEQGLILQTNVRAAWLLGMEKEALVNQPVSRFIFRDDQDAYYRCRKRLAESRDAQTFELRLLRQGGTQFWAQMDASTARGVDGRPVHRIALSDINERKLAEAALHRGESEFRNLFELSVVGGAQADPLNGRLLRVNRKLCEITGYDADELLRMSFIEITHPDDRATNWQNYRNAMAGRQKMYCADKRYVRKTGEIVWVNVQVTPQCDDHGRILYTLAVIQDITARKEAEVAMRDRLELQGRLAKIAATVPGVICSFKRRPDGSVCMPFASVALESIYGLHPEDVREDATQLLARIHPGDIGYINETIAASASTMTAWRAEYRVRHPRKGEIWVEGHSMPQREPDGSILWHGFIKEVTDRKRMEAALRDSERLYRAIGESINYGVWISAADGRNLYFSDSFLNLVGFSQDKCSDFGWITMLHPDDAERTFGAWMACVRSGADWDMEHRFRGVDGLWHDVLARGVPVRNERGEITHWAGINLDISRQKQVEQSLRNTQLDLQRAQAVARTGSWRLDITRNELLWSDENHRIFGVPKGVPLSYETFLSVVHPDDRAVVDEAWKAALRGEDYNIEHRIVVNGEVRWVKERVELEFGAKGILLGGLGSTQDITERKRSEAALAQSESRLRLAMEAVTSLVYDWDRVADAAYCSIGLNRVFGARAAGEHFSRAWWRSRVHPDDLRLIRPEVVRCIRSGGDRIHVEYRMRHMDGHWVHVSDCALLVRNGAARVVRVVGSLTDISDRKNAEAALLRLNDTLEEQVAERTSEAETRAQALLESERLTRATIDALSSPLCVLDASAHIIAVNKAWSLFAVKNGGCAELLGVGADYLAVCDAARQAGCATAVKVAEAIRAAIDGCEEEFAIEYECSAPNERRWFVISLSVFPGEGPLRLVAMHKDITERKLAAEEQIESAARLKRLAAHLETVREEQSTTIAREVHDELGGTLTMLKLGLATSIDGLALSVAQKARFKDLIGQVDTALGTVKRISAGLRPAMLDTLGLVATIRWHAADFSRMTGIATDVRIPDAVSLSPVRNTAVFRIVQEALTNVAKHAGASKVSILMWEEAGSLIVKVSDNGKGLSENYRRKHASFGLIGMRERAQYLGGSLSIRGASGESTCLTLRIPLEDQAENRSTDDGDGTDCR